MQSYKKCDHFPDCLDGSDEKNCNYTCPKGKVVCPKGKLLFSVFSDYVYCLPESELCNTYPFVPKMKELKSKSIWLIFFFRDCTNSSDEENCAHNSCSADDFQCKRGHSYHDRRCVHSRFRCNGYYDCSDGSDESNCSVNCTKGEILCPNGTCIAQNKVCDGFSDCPGGDDEKYCNASCALDEFKCKNGSDLRSVHNCIPKVFVRFIILIKIFYL